MGCCYICGQIELPTRNVCVKRNSEGQSAFVTGKGKKMKKTTIFANCLTLLSSVLTVLSK